MQDLFDYTQATGHIYSPSERVALATSLPLLASRTKRRNLVIWGKLLGYKADYIIVQGFDDDLVAEPELYYTVDEGLTFTLLGTVSALLSSLLTMSTNPLERQDLKQRLVRQMRGSFVGDPAYEYRLVDPITQEAASYKESVRLALFVEEHDYHCRVAPRGAYIKSERNDTLPMEIRRNDAFEGLPKTQEGALCMANYYHIRPFNPYRRLITMNQNTLFEKNCLEMMQENAQVDAAFDSITDDIPSGMWRLRYEAMHNLVVGTNAMFVGSMFYHIPETYKYGSVYMGNGTINEDVAFEI